MGKIFWCEMRTEILTRLKHIFIIVFIFLLCSSPIFIYDMVYTPEPILRIEPISIETVKDVKNRIVWKVIIFIDTVATDSVFKDYLKGGVVKTKHKSLKFNDLSKKPSRIVKKL